MKSWCGFQQLAKCNFCLNWYDITHQHYSALTNLYVCPGCFDRCRKSSHFRVAQPKTMNVYEVLFKKCPSQELDLLKGQSNQLLELADLYEAKNMGTEKLDTFRNFVADLVGYQNDILNQIEPIREFINKIYRAELNRIEKIWEEVVEEVENIGLQVAQYRKTITENLQNQANAIDTVESGFNDLKQKVNSKFQNYDLQRIQEMYKEGSNRFFQNGFKINPENDVGLSAHKNSLLKTKSDKSQYFPSPKQSSVKRQGSALKFKDRKLLSNFRLNEKENIFKTLQRSTSPFLRSPKQSNILKTLNFGSKKDIANFESTIHTDDDKRQSTKNQIKQLLKKKQVLSSYKNNEEKIQSKLLYSDMVMKQTIYQALEMTFIGNNMIELIAYNIQHIDYQCYLEMLKWNPQLQTVKFVKVGLTDDHLNMLLNYLKNSTKIESLVITNNLLTDGCLDILCNYFSTERPIKTVYLSRNYIQPIKCRHRINELKRLNVNLFI